MGKSRKAVKRRVSSKVSIKKKKKSKQTKAVATLPKSVKENLQIPASSVHQKAAWDDKKTLKKNYAMNKVKMDVNAIEMDVDTGEEKVENTEIESNFS